MPIEREQAVREVAVGGAGPQAPGDYRLIAELARGDKATVYLVLRRGPGTSTRLLALKELDSDPFEDPDLWRSPEPPPPRPPEKPSARLA